MKLKQITAAALALVLLTVLSACGTAPVPQGGIPAPDVQTEDVPADADIAREVYAFYAAGILTGYTDDGVHRAGAFDPGGQITRAEVATIMHRMFEPDARVRFEMG